MQKYEVDTEGPISINVPIDLKDRLIWSDFQKRAILTRDELEAKFREYWDSQLSLRDVYILDDLFPNKSETKVNATIDYNTVRTELYRYIEHVNWCETKKVTPMLLNTWLDDYRASNGVT